MSCPVVIMNIVEYIILHNSNRKYDSRIIGRMDIAQLDYDGIRNELF